MQWVELAQVAVGGRKMFEGGWGWVCGGAGAHTGAEGSPRRWGGKVTPDGGKVVSEQRKCCASR